MNFNTIIRTLFFSFAILKVSTSFAQSIVPKIIPPSPEASAFAKYGEYPVDMYYGKANISIPLFEIKSKEISWPISISYNSTGIKVKEIASNVGLGWVLNASGCISSSIRGASDVDTPNDFGFMQKGQEIMSSIQGMGMLKDVPLHACEDRYYDTESDVYNYNFNGHTGQFRFGGNGPRDIVFSPENSTLKIEYKPNENSNSIPDQDLKNRFEVIDDKGFIYQFSISETSITYFASMQIRSSSAWFLTKVLSPNRTDSICFYYSRYTNYVESCSYSGLNSLIPEIYSQLPGPNTNNENRSLDTYTYNSWVLDSINYSNGRVIFNHDTNREDFFGNNGMKYNEIDFYNANRELIKKVNLNYDYFRNGSEYSDKRLKLTSIDIKDSNGKVQEPYSFSYDPNLLPSIKSKQQDYWGYYNGYSVNDSPNQTILPKSTLLPSLNYGIRTANSYYMQASVLTQITYPTGGYTKFDFEPHDVLSTVKGKDEMIQISQSPLICDDIVKTVSTAGTYTVDIKVVFPPIPDNIFNGKSDVQLIKITGIQSPTSNNLLLLSNGLKGTDVYSHPVSGNNFTAWDISEQAQILKGATLGITVKAICINGTAYRPTIIISYRNEDYTGDQIVTIGGLRVSKISSYDGINPKPLIKTYKYAHGSYILGNGTQLFEYKLPYYFKNNSLCRNDQTTAVVRSETNLLDGGTSSNPICYTKVEEYLGDDTNFLGKTVTEYSFTPNNGIVGSYPFTPAIDNSVFRGKPCSITYYDKDLNIIKKINNHYRTQFYTMGRSILCSPLALNIKDGTTGWTCCPTGSECKQVYGTGSSNKDYTYSPYTFESYNVFLDSTITLDYFHGTAVKSVKQYSYMSSYPFLKNKEISYLSNGGSSVNEIRYPADINTNIYSAMTDYTNNRKNMHNYPIETITRVNNKITASQLYLYKYDKGHIVQDKVYLLETSAPLNSINTFNGIDKDSHYSLIPEIEFTNYDSNGGVLQFTDKSGIVNTYLWDISRVYPIAKLAGATYSSVVDFDRKKSDYSSTTLYNDLKAIVPTAIITTYSYRSQFGMISQTDENGFTTFYDYDSFGRLNQVKDKDGNILKKMTYHYKGQ